MRVGIDARKIADFGIGTYIRGLLQGLLELQSGDTFVAFAPEGAPVPAGIEHVIADAPHYSLRELFAIGRAADRARLDVFHAPHYVVPVTRVPLVVTIHDLIHLHQPLSNPIAKLYARTMLRRAVQKARCVLTVSHSVRRELIEELGAKDVMVTPNGVSASSTATFGAPRATSGARHFLFVGNDKPHKNADTLIAALARVPGAKLVMAGASFERFAGVERVERRGFVSDDELRALYASAFALVMPSIEEGFGLPALEAMACGTAVITSNASALVEVTGDAALHVDARDADALADAMTRVMHDDELRAQLGANGVARAASFTWKRCAETAMEAYGVAAGRGTSWNTR